MPSTTPFDLDDLWKPATLSDELTPYVTKGAFSMLRHPLVYFVPYSDNLANYANLLLENKKAAAAAALEAADFSRYVFLHERPYRPNALHEVEPRLKDAAYWQLLRSVYQDSENIEETTCLWEHLLSVDKLGKEHMMYPEEHEAFSKLPAVLTVWRGVPCKADMYAGFSWSLSEKVAKWFALRGHKSSSACYLAKGNIAKSDILAHLLTRNEFEVMAWPKDVHDIELIRL
jgi:hypothetical protein